MNIHTTHGGPRRRQGRRHARRPVGGHRIITGLIPCNVIPDEILTDHPKRFRAMIVESANPAHSLADSQRMREALDALELVVVIDVAMTETARLRRLRAAGAVAVREVGGDVLHPRVPATTSSTCARRCFEPLPGHAARAGDPPPPGARARRAHATTTSRRCARPRPQGRAAFAPAFLQTMAERPDLAGARAGRALRDARADARRRRRGGGRCSGAPRTPARWRTPSRCGAPASTARARRSARRSSRRSSRRRSGVTFTVDEYDETWRRLAHARRQDQPRRSPSCSTSSRALRDERPRGATRRSRSCSPPASAARRPPTRSSAIPAWRKKDAGRRAAHEPRRRRAPRRRRRRPGARHDQARQRRGDRRGRPTRCRPGHVSLPNGLGPRLPGRGRRSRSCTASRRTSSPPSEDRDWLAGTPWHKHVRGAGRGGRRARRMRRTRFDDWPCPIARATDLIGDWWTPLVLREAFVGPAPLRGLPARRSACRAPCSRSGSSGWSTRAAGEAAVRRAAAALRVPPDRQGPRVLGRPRRDVALGQRLAVADGKRPPVILVDRETGAEIRPVVVDEATGKRLDVRRLRVARARA